MGSGDTERVGAGVSGVWVGLGSGDGVGLPTTHVVLLICK